MSGTVGVVGAGTMGLGIAQCLAEGGYDVVVVDPTLGSATGVAAAVDRLRTGLRQARLLAPHRVGEPVARVTERISWADRTAGLDRAGYVIECAPERIPLKERIFGELDAVCPPSTVLASVTSAIPIDRLAASTRRPDRVVGTHFMNPAPLRDSVEVVRAPRTSADALQRTLDLLAAIGKTGIVVADGPGFVINRVLMLTVNEAAEVVGQGTADAATVDRVFQECLGHATGPLRTADLIGLDTVVDTLLVLLECTGDPRFRPGRTLRELVDAGRYGRKSGSGFHQYPRPVATAAT
ncbi:3-hydroxyacyl-CoA dehydrogenase family protein [Micromonospora sp. DSM 115977]|uniref:3-hydroxyacyl-CoA dehydrogenase family protein n=1 Tax=Micromonospora reichwaldensis TaxID=3075516 RepID=A0ABU2WX46_9ACTN|nr:3-hydroxyacyl-CoA dehydrogenase family protein [Micromonospora sp. DSM 115977]MDT0530508.1 3-hydroxyacyl-CoA dehydrogenase family protein [Micromonospora sp. DSM 115977]